MNQNDIKINKWITIIVYANAFKDKIYGLAYISDATYASLLTRHVLNSA